ncbi:unnamed protein product [Periconia digitata]|uniref:Cytochrome c oxidase assembly protein COX20, mitochondrial n=1 Tax=Periconia digitata TaxID=1303443 RepID=A0A9W4UMW6_9PLEO|nr:unnamed protein product [Periconia digitata]
MADDTRQQSQQSQQPQPPSSIPSEAPNASEILRASRPPANIMPGGTAHTAGGQRVEDGPTYFDVVRRLGPEYYLNFHKRPCVRDGLMTGIASGFVAGSVAAVLRRPVYLCTNWAVGICVMAACGHYQTCQYYRGREKDGMKQAQVLIEKKRASMEAKKEARRRAREEQERIEEMQRQEQIRRKSWSYWASKNLKFW